MPISRRVQIAVVVLAVAALLALVFTRGGKTDPPAAASGAAVPAPVAAEVVGVRAGPGDRSVVIQVSLPAGGPDCARDPRIELLTEENDVVYANVVYDGAMSATCPDRKPAEIVLRTPGPLGDRVLSLNSQDTWGRAGDVYERCDKYLGCHPPADHCAEAWIDQTVFGLDVPVKRLHGVRDVRGCDGNWLVLDFNRSAGDCPAAEGAPKCASTGPTTRLFFEWRGQGWIQFAGTVRAGCADAQAARPAFPAALCQDLPPVPAR